MKTLKTRTAIPPTMWQILIIISLASVSFITSEYAHAEKNQFITISLSKTCEKLLQLNSTVCPSYQELISYDNSIPFLLGEFEIQDGLYKRQPSIFVQPEHYFNQEDKWRIVIDPPINLYGVSKNIHIQNNFDSFMRFGHLDPNHNILSDNTNKSIDIYYTKTHSYHVHNDYYIDNRCKNIYLNALTWFAYLDDLITVLKDDCENPLIPTNNTMTISIPHTNIDITTSRYYQDQQRLEYIKENCLQSFASCQEIPDFN